MNVILNCSQCNQEFILKTKRHNSTGNVFCSKKCVFDAQRPGGITYETKKVRSLEKHGTQFPMSSASIKDKRKKNTLEKYGVENSFQLDEVKEKIKKTLITKYGVESFSKTEDFKKKVQETCFERFGFSSPIENPEILEKRRQTMIERWGGPSTFESDVLRSRAEETCISRYGTRNIVLSPTFISSSMDKKLMKTHGKTWQQYIDDLPEFHDYRRRVDKITRQQPVEELANYDKWGEFHLDHMFSVAEGFKQQISPEIIGNIVNLKFIPAIENMKKQSLCTIDKDTLLLEYSKRREDTK